MIPFSELGLSKDAMEAVKKMGYENPTPVQEQAIPFVLEGRDLIAAASTGTGKTAAFLLPVLSTLPKAKGRRRAPRVLVISPTRELAQQIGHTAMQITRKTGHFVTTVYGGSSYGPQIKELRGGTDLLIATPGRLMDLIKRGVVELGEISTLVLDEADRMLDMGFLPDVTSIVEKTPECRQTLLFSATIDQSIQNNLGTLLKDPAVVEVARNGETAKSVAQFIMPIGHKNKPDLLKAVLEEKGSERVIVFARTKFRTEECAKALCDAGFSAESIHSDKTQGQRRRALTNFRKNKTSVLVATDVLARGIDVPDVDHVINFDLPDMPEDYVHRIGRTGRAEKEGYAISFVTRETRRMLREIEKLIEKDIPVMEIEGYELDPSQLEGKKHRDGKSRTKKSGNGSRRRNGKNYDRKNDRRKGGEQGVDERRSSRRGDYRQAPRKEDISRSSRNGEASKRRRSKRGDFNLEAKRGGFDEFQTRGERNRSERRHGDSKGKDIRPGRASRREREESHKRHMAKHEGASGKNRPPRAKKQRGQRAPRRG